MTFLDTLGQMAEETASKVGDLSGLTDAWHDLSVAYSGVSDALGHPKNDNTNGEVISALGSALHAPAELGLHLLHNMGTAASYAQAANTLGWSQALDPSVSWDTRFDQTIGAVQRNPDNQNNYMAGVSLGQLVGNAMPWTNTGNNIFYMSQEEKDRAFGSGPNEYFTGSIDFANSLIVDPSNLAGPAGKAARSLVAGKEITQAASVAFGKGAVQISAKNFGNLIENAVQNARLGGNNLDHTAQMIQDFADKDATYAMSHPWVKAQKASDRTLIANLLGGTQTPEQAGDVLHVLSRTPGWEFAYKRLSDDAASLSGAVASDRAIGLQAIVDGAPSQSTLEQNFVEHLTDPNGSLTRAWQRSLDNAAQRQVITRGFGTDAYVGIQNAAAARRAGRIGEESARGEPRVFISQPTRAHAIMAVVDFFGKERGSGWINFNDSDSVEEISALLNDINRETDGHMVSSGEGREWINQYLAATTNAEKSKVAQLIEQRGIELLAAKHSTADNPITADAARYLWESGNTRRAAAMQQYADKKFIGWVVGDRNAFAKSPLLERENVDMLPLMDMKELNVALARHDNSVINSFGQAKDLGVGAADTLNDIWKMAVLMRFGYTLRNLTEAGLSIAATGMAHATVLTALAEQNLLQWQRGVWDRTAERFGVATGRRLAVSAAYREEALKYAGVRVAQGNLDNLTRAQLRLASMRLSATDRDILARHAAEERFTSGAYQGVPEANNLVANSAYQGLTREEHKRALDLRKQLRDMAALRNETTARQTYHCGTSDFRQIEGDYIDTTPESTVAKLRMDDPYEPLNFESVNNRPQAFADRHPTTWRYVRPRASDPTSSEVFVERASEIPTQLRNGYNNMMDAAVEHAMNGYVVEELRGNVWKEVSEDYLTRLRNREVFTRADARRRFRVRPDGPAPQVHNIVSYGRELDLTKFDTVPEDLKPILNIHSSKPRETARKRANKPSHQEWVQNESWNDPEVAAKLTQYAKDNGYGRIILPDDEWGQTVRILKNNVDGYGGRGPMASVDAHIQEMLHEAENTSYFGALRPTGRQATAMDRRSNRRLRAAARRDGTHIHEWEVASGYNSDKIAQMASEDGLNSIRNAAIGLHQAKADHAEAILRRQQAEERVANVHANDRSFGKKGIPVTLSDGRVIHVTAFGGSQGEINWTRTHGDTAYVNGLVGDGQVINNNLSGYDKVVVGKNDPEYFSSWANVLNFHWRDPTVPGKAGLDPLARLAHEGSGPQGMEDWLKGDGRAYADEMGWNDAEIPKAAATMYEAYHQYVPETMRQAWEDGRISPQMLQDGVDPRDLPEIVGLRVPQSREFRDAMTIRRASETATRKLMHALGSAPETALARHPLYVASFRKDLEKSVRQAELEKGEKLTLDEVNVLAKSSREEARRIVNKTLFTITRRTGASSTFRLISPFYAAWENVMKRWSTFAVEDTENIARGLVLKQKFLNNAVLVNSKTGERGDPYNDSVQDLSMVFPWKVGGQNANIPVASMDVIFQGQPLNPGIGPFIALPLSKIVAERPEAEKVLNWAFPAGYPRDELSVWLPASLNKLRSMHNQDQAYMNDMNRIAMHEMILYQQGKRKDLPSQSELTEKTNQLYSLKTLTNLLSPASVQYTNDVNYYQQLYRKYQTMYPDQGTADQRFLEDHPDYFVVMEPLSKNQFGATATLQSVDNVKKYSDLAAAASASGDPKMVGWLANYGQGKYDQSQFSQAAYNWQLDHSPVPGGDAFRTQKNPQEVMRDALVNRGWIRFNQAMDEVTANYQARGLNIADPTVHKAMMNGVVSFLTQDSSNTPWYEEFKSADKSRFERRADFFQQALTDPSFAGDHKNDSTIQTIGAFLDLRSQMANALNDVKANGGSNRLSAKSNYQLAQDYLQQIVRLKNQNLGFSEWYDKYFTNDPVVL
jgi:hypothetical protein